MSVVCASLPAVANWYEPIGGFMMMAPSGHATGGAGPRPPQRTGGIAMKKRLLGALALAAALLVSAVAASAGSSSPDRQTATKVVIWLQNDADSGWKQMVTSTNDAFKAKHRDVDVDVQYQSWGDHLTKFDAALAGGHRSRRHRAREHGDDPLHGESPASRT